MIQCSKHECKCTYHIAPQLREVLTMHALNQHQHMSLSSMSSLAHLSHFVLGVGDKFRRLVIFVRVEHKEQDIRGLDARLTHTHLDPYVGGRRKTEPVLMAADDTTFITALTLTINFKVKATFTGDVVPCLDGDIRHTCTCTCSRHTYIHVSVPYPKPKDGYLT